MSKTPPPDNRGDEFKRLASQLAGVVGRLESAAEIVDNEDVWTLIDSLEHESQRLFATVLTPGRTSARARLLAYLVKRPRAWVAASTLRRVAGITAWQRRLRELRLDEGWRIESGGTSYRLQVTVADTGSAVRRRERRGRSQRANEAAVRSGDSDH
jgi:hypothetical protein